MSLACERHVPSLTLSICQRATSMEVRISDGHSLARAPEEFIVHVPTQIVANVPANIPRALLAEYIARLIIERSPSLARSATSRFSGNRPPPPTSTRAPATWRSADLAGLPTERPIALADPFRQIPPPWAQRTAPGYRLFRGREFQTGSQVARSRFTLPLALVRHLFDARLHDFFAKRNA